MDDHAKADLEKLETLREQALCGPPEQREQAEQAYEELRETLFSHQACEVPGDDSETKELTALATSTCEDCGQVFTPAEGEPPRGEGQPGETPKLCPACRRVEQNAQG